MTSKQHEHPWFKQYRTTHDDAEAWFDVEKQVFPDEILNQQKTKVKKKRKSVKQDGG